MKQLDFALLPTLIHHLRRRAQEVPGRRIFTFADVEEADICLDYDHLDRDARRLAVALAAHAIKGDRVILMHAPGPDYVIALLGCFYAGLVAVPAYPPRFNRPMERLRSLVADAGARMALTGAAALESMRPHIAADDELSRLTWLATDALPETVSADAWQEPDIGADTLALLQYTSGSTSAPKGVMITHAHLRNNVLAMAQALNAGPEERMVSWLPPYHDMGLVGGVLAPLFLGMECRLLAPATFLQRPLRWLSAIAQHRATISGAPNFGYELCVRRITPEQRAQLDLSSWRVAFCGAERVRAGTLQQFARQFALSGFRAGALTPCYGLAEATLAVSFSTGELGYADGQTREPITVPVGDIDASTPESARLSVGCGSAIPGVEVRLVDPDSRILPEGEVGEIWVRSSALAAGYWGKPDLTEASFHARPAGSDAGSDPYLRTGDLGFMRRGQLHVLGRLKDLIILRGVNVYPEDVEAIAERVHDCLRPAGAVAFGVEHEDEEQLIIVQELNPRVRGVALERVAADIHREVADALQLAVHQVVLVAPGAVPRTSSGKVQRRRCRELYLGGDLEVVHDSVAPTSGPSAAAPELIEQVAGLMAELLGVQSVLPDDDFFWLGGHSLLATQLASRLRTAFSIELPLSELFAAATPRRLAARIAASSADALRVEIRPVDRSGPLPLTFSQERMWLLHQLDPAGTAYNVAGAVQIDGALNAVLLSRAFSQVVQRHEILRTRYPTIDGGASLRIVAATEISLPVLDLTAEADAVQAALHRASKLARQPFDIAADPLLRVALFRVGVDRHVLAVCLHHLVTDAWSMGLLVRDLLSCYDALAAGQVATLASPAISYIDYAQWQREFMSGTRLQPQRDYWQAQLRGATAIELPADRPRHRQRTSAGELEPLPLCGPLMESIAALARAHGATPFMVMLAAFDVLLYRWTGRNDLVVGVPVANRNWQESEALMGTLVNTLPMRMRFAEGASFVELLQEVRHRALAAYAHQDLPFEQLIAELPLERRPGVAPLVSVMFDYQNTPLQGRSSGALTLQPLFLSRGSAQFDLSLLILDTDLGRIAGVEYSTDLFEPATIRRMLGHYLTILEAVVLDPTTAIDRLPLLRGTERGELLRGAQRCCHAEAAPPPLMQSIEQQFVRSAERLAVQDQDICLSYAQLQQRVWQLSQHLATMGVGPGKRVAVCLERGVDLLVALLAVLHRGAAYVPLDPHHPAERLGYVLEDAEPQLLLTQQRLTAIQALGTGLRVVCLESLETAPHSVVAAAVSCDEALPAYVIYTSGSTGRPKGVEIPRRALANFVASMRRSPGIDAQDRLLSVTTVAFDIAGMELYLPLVAGACVYIAGSDVVSDGPRLLQLMLDWDTTFMQATPAGWKLLIEAGWRGSRRLKALCGGEPFPRELAGQLLERADSVWNMYGPTETTIWSTLQRVMPVDDTLVPIGIPIAETAVYLLDRHLQPVPQGIPGEIWIGGLGVANGYYRRPELTAERFLPDPFMPAQLARHARMYRTGDAGRLRCDALLEHLGRLDDQIKIRGFRIEPGEIEQVLKEHQTVADAVVVAREVRPGDLRLVAYYVPVRHSSGQEATRVGVLLESLRRRLPAYMIPVALVPMSAFPTTPNNKIDRRALPAPELDLSVSEAEYLPARDEVEAVLVAIWQELIGIHRVGVRDDFFVLGGHSLLAVRMFARIEKQFGTRLPLAILFERSTIEFLAEAIREVQRAQPPAVPAAMRFLVPIQKSGSRPPFFCVHGAGGNVLNLLPLARHLGADQPFYGFQAQGVDGLLAPLSDIRAMASGYLQELRQVQPSGPYHLGGYCAGGWVALELARQLEALGETVALLVLFDCYHPRLQPEVAPMRNLFNGIRQGGLPYLWRRAPGNILRYLRVASGHLRIALWRVLGRAVPLELRDLWLTGAMLRAAAHYHPAAYRDDVVLMRASWIDPQLRDAGARMGWDDVLTGKVTVVDIPGDHFTLAEEPHVRDLAQQLRVCILHTSDAPATDLPICA
ncbi:MAG: amino acid adenylation domain-containing protein [Steroidobacteraceae bacterium]